MWFHPLGDFNPSLLFVCKQIHAETVGILWGENTFRFSSVDCGARLLSRYASMMPRIRRIWIEWRVFDQNEEFFDRLALLTNLEVLFIDANHSRPPRGLEPAGISEMAYGQCKNWLEAVALRAGNSTQVAMDKLVFKSYTWQGRHSKPQNVVDLRDDFDTYLRAALHDRAGQGARKASK